MKLRSGRLEYSDGKAYLMHFKGWRLRNRMAEGN